MELKVWVEGIQRIVCGVTEKTTCQDVVYALAHATGKTGRFTLIERWRNNERLLAPQEHPLKVLQKWGEYSHDVQFILQRSALDAPPGGQGTQPQSKNSAKPPLSPNSVRRQHLIQQQKEAGNPPPAVWKPPPPGGTTTHPGANGVNPRLSPDSGRGSDKTGGSDTSYSDKEQQHQQQQQQQQQQQIVRQNNSRLFHPSQGQPYQQGMVNGYPQHRFTPTLGLGGANFNPNQPPAYRPPPPASSLLGRNSSPANSVTTEFQPPPYRNPPPPPTRYRNSGGTTAGMHQPLVRVPHYSPPPTQRNALSRHASRSSLIGHQNSGGASSSTSRMNQHGLPSVPPSSGAYPVSRSVGGAHQRTSRLQQHQQYKKGVPSTDVNDLMNLVSAQQSTLHSQQAEIKQCDAETSYFEGMYKQQNGQQPSSSDHYPKSTSSSSLMSQQQQPQLLYSSQQQQQSENQQLELVLSEVRRLEEVAQQNDSELMVLGATEAQQLQQQQQKMAGNSNRVKSPTMEDEVIFTEISHLKQRLAGTDQELYKTNSTLKILGDEMRSMSLEKSRQREQELSQEIDRLQVEIKSLQLSSEEGATISQQLSKEVKDVEEQISARKAEVENLIKEMREANMESLAISPPEESKPFLDGESAQGPVKPGSQRKMLSSPRALESAVPTAKNPHGVWV